MVDVDWDGSLTLSGSKSTNDSGSSSIIFNGSMSDGTNNGSIIATQDDDAGGIGGGGSIIRSANSSSASVSVIQSSIKLYDDAFESFEMAVNTSFDEMSSASSS